MDIVEHSVSVSKYDSSCYYKSITVNIFVLESDVVIGCCLAEPSESVDSDDAEVLREEEFKRYLGFIHAKDIL